MKSSSERFFTSGIGLIEVLITTVVIALGLLAVARFQVGVIGESRDNKALVEARNFCESGIEDLRSLMSRADFIAFTEDLTPAEEQFTGKSAVFTRTLQVENLPDPGVTTNQDSREKRITATCSWDGAEQPVVLQTVLSLHGANSSALAVGLGGGGGPAISPSLNAGSSDDISQVLPLQPSDDGYGQPGEVVLIDGDYFIVQSNGQSAAKSERCADLDPVPASFESGLRARRKDNDGVAGMESIELFEVVADAGGALCVPRVRFNGGVVVPIRGIVHSRISTKVNDTYLPVDLFTLNVSESGAYCVFNPEPGATSAPYTCYVGGNCAYGPEGTDDADVTQCPTTRLAGVLDNVGEGGWRGRVGLLNVANAGYNVCFSEEVGGPAETRDTARSYFSLNFGPDMTLGTIDDRSHGINKPYACHDFLIVDGINSPQPAALSKECQDQAETVGGLKLASKSISRSIATGSYSNVFDPIVNVDSCSEIPGTSYTVTGVLVDQIGNPQVQASDGISTWQCIVDTGSYSCTFTTQSDAVQISAQGGISDPDPCIVSLDPLNPLGTGCAFTFAATTDPTYRISGFIFGDALSTELSPSGALRALGALYSGTDVGCSVGSHSAADGGRVYECVFVAPETDPLPVVTLYAQTAPQYNATFENGQRDVDLAGYVGDSPRQVEGPDLTVAAVPTYQLSGTISFPGIGGGTTVTPALNPELSQGCTTPAELRNNSSSTTYSCTVLAGEQVVTYTISPACSKGQGQNKSGNRYLMTSGAATSDSGSLVVDLGNVSSDRTVNVTISESNVPCGG